MIWLLALLGSLWLSPACDTGLCTCVGPRTPAQALESADAAFTGRVIRMRDTVFPGEPPNGGWQRRYVTLRVDRSWKGVETRTVTVVTGTGGGDCGFPFEEGESYLVYARGGPDELETSICGRTSDLSYAAADLRALGAPRRTWRAGRAVRP